MNVQKNIVNIEKSRIYRKGGITFKVASNQPSEKALRQFGQKLKALSYDYQNDYQTAFQCSYMRWCG